MSIKKFSKDPSARLDYTIDWSAWLAIDDDTIASATVPDPPDGLDIELVSHTDTSTTVWVSGGTAGTSYDVAVHIVTAGAREDERTITIACKEM